MSTPKTPHIRRQYTKELIPDAITLSETLGVATPADQLGFTSTFDL